MKIRLKFRNKFHTYEAPDPNKNLLDLLHAASELFKIELPNVQISLNANDFVGLEESDATIAAMGIVSGDIVYVKSLESLDDIRRSMEFELTKSIDIVYKQQGVPEHTLSSLCAIPLIVFATAKGLQFHGTVRDGLSTSCTVARLPFTFSSVPGIQILITVYTTGNLLCIAASASGVKFAKQLLIPVRDHMVTTTLSSKDSLPSPSMIFKNLQLLSIRCKDELIEPMLIQLCAERGLPERVMLSNLPSELLIRVLSFLPLRALGRLMICNSQLFERVKFCAPLWRMQLRRLNAKKQPLLEAALTRQLRHQQQLRPVQSSEPYSPSCASPTSQETNAVPTSPTESESELDEAGFEMNTHTAESYDRFVARYRSLLSQRKNRGLSPVFV